MSDWKYLTPEELIENLDNTVMEEAKKMKKRLN